MSDLYGRWHSALAALLEEKDREGALRLHGDAHGVAAVVTALGEGLAIQAAADPGWARAPSLSQALAAARVLLNRAWKLVDVVEDLTWLPPLSEARMATGVEARTGLRCGRA